MSFNLAVILRESAKRFPDKAAAICEGTRLSYRDLDAQSDRVAANLQRLGVAPGAAVGLQLPNIPEFLVVYFGILKAGAVCVPMNVLLKAPEVAFHLGDSQAVALVTLTSVTAESMKGASEAGVREVFVVGAADGSPTGGRDFAELLADDGRPAPVFVPREPGDAAVLLYTSGTTGRPKGAELSHFQLYMNCDIPGRLFEVSTDDIIVTALPLFHVFGLSSVLNVSVRFGGTVVLIPRFDADTVLTAIERDRATVFEGVPTMFFALLAHPELDRFDLSSLRVAISGGAAIPAEVIDAFEKRFGLVILEGYGLSETASTTSFNVSAEERRVYSVGKPIWGAEVQIWGADSQPLPPGRDSVGEIVTRGFHVTKGYHGQPEATAEAFAGGWFHTGDLGYIDEDGFIFIVDRKKELIIRGGYNVYPREVEEVLYAHPAVAEAAVIGVPDERLGEEVRAYVVLKKPGQPTETDLIAYCKTQLAAYKYPRSVEIRESLPKGPTGKILKKELKAEFERTS